MRCTEQQKAVLQGLAAGLRLQQIARQESLSLWTVEHIIAALEQELDAPTRFRLGMRAVELGLI